VAIDELLRVGGICGFSLIPFVIVTWTSEPHLCNASLLKLCIQGFECARVKCFCPWRVKVFWTILVGGDDVCCTWGSKPWGRVLKLLLYLRQRRLLIVGGSGRVIWIVSNNLESIFDR
jgi:hypothetical protein